MQKQYKSGDHLIICGSCGNERYRSEMQWTWDNRLLCTVLNCWYPRHAIFDNPPVINDPITLQDVRPPSTDTYVSDANQAGLMTTFGNWDIKFGDANVKFGAIDNPPNYIGS